MDVKEVKNINDIQRGDILILSDPADEKRPIHALMCSGDNPLAYPIEGKTVVHAHAVRDAEQVSIHMLNFYMDHAREGSKLYVFRPQNEALAQKAFDILMHWYQMGTYFDIKLKERQDKADPTTVKSTFTPLRSIKQHFLNSYTNFYLENFSSSLYEITRNEREKGVSCHSLLIDAFNLASLQLSYENAGIPLTKEEYPVRMSNYGNIHAQVATSVLQVIKEKESSKHKQQAIYHSPVNYLTLAQRKLLEEGSVTKEMPFQLNSNVVKITDFHAAIKVSNDFKLVATFDKKEMSPSISKEEYLQKIEPWTPGFNEARSQFRRQKVALFQDSTKIQNNNVALKNEAFAKFIQKDYDNAIQKFSEIKLDYLMPLDKAMHYWLLGSCYEGKVDNTQALENFREAEKIYKTYLEPTHAQVKKVEDKIQLIQQKVSQTPSVSQ